MDKEQLQDIYSKKEYYWGKEPNELTSLVLRYILPKHRQGAKLVDIGAGEGRDAVFFAKEGLDVLAVDIAPAGLKKSHKLAAEMGTKINTLEAEINELILPEQFDIVYSIGTLQYIQPRRRNHQFEHLKDQTTPGGLNIMCTFVQHPQVDIAPDWGENEYLYQREELQGYYLGWDVLYSNEFVFDCNSSNIPHQHAVCTIIAKKPLTTV